MQDQKPREVERVLLPSCPSALSEPRKELSVESKSKPTDKQASQKGVCNLCIDLCHIIVEQPNHVCDFHTVRLNLDGSEKILESTKHVKKLKPETKEKLVENAKKLSVCKLCHRQAKIKFYYRYKNVMNSVSSIKLKKILAVQFQLIF